MVARALIRALAGLSGIRADCDALARPLLSFAGLSAVLPFIHAGAVLALARRPALALTRRLSRLAGSLGFPVSLCNLLRGHRLLSI